ncbi:MAG: hypothetical protein R3A45_07095 [Bdellovibrionota bacterium]
MPKFFTIVSQATHRETGEVFTIESRIQVRLENYSEIAYGVRGVGSFPYNPWRYNFIPSVYGRVHLNIPDNNIQFMHGGWVDDNGGAYPSKAGDSNVHTFLGPVTFENLHEHDFGGDKNLPFYRENKEIGRWDIYLRPELKFTKGLDYPVNLVAEPGDAGYKKELDPSTAEYFNVLQGTASSGYGIDLSGTGGSCQTNSVTGNSEVNICLKMQGTDLLQYDCNNVDPDVGEFFMQPSVDQVIWANDVNIASAITSFPDRYMGERADVIAGNTNHATNTHTLGGVIYCRETSCDCNLHIKGIYAETVTFAADNVVIEGDIVSADQDPINSPYTLGVIAKENIIIPQGIPQGANPSPLSA